MSNLSANIIYDSSPNTERLIKFSMFYFDKVDLHLPDVCTMIFENLPNKMSEYSYFFSSGNQIYNVISILNFYNETATKKLECLSTGSNLKISTFVNDRIILDYTTKMAAVSDGKGRLAYDYKKTKYEQGDSPINRVSKWNKEKKESDIMKIIKSNIQSVVFKGALCENESGFEFEEDISIDDDILSVFKTACNDKIVQYLYQYYGEYVYKHDYLKLYTWFQEYYYTLLGYFYNVLAGVENVIISNNILGKIIEDSTRLKGVNSKTKHLADKQISQILVPDFFDLEYEDIFELKEIANDEIIALRHYIQTLGAMESIEESNHIIQTKVMPSVRELENKISNMRISLLQKAIREIRNPVSYLPLLSTLVTNLDTKLATAISLGVMGADLALEYYKEKRNIKNHPLYFSVNLNRKIQGMVY